MEPAGCDTDLVSDHLVDEPVLVRDTSRPVAVQPVLERFRLADADIRGVVRGTASDVPEQIVDPPEDASVLALPVEVVGPGILVPHVLHSSSSPSAPWPDSSLSIDESNRRAFAGFCRRYAVSLSDS